MQRLQRRCLSRVQLAMRSVISGAWRALLAGSVLGSGAAVAGDAEILDPDDFRVSYVYAAVMGTGTYKIDGRRISMLQLPLKVTQREASEEQVGISWYLPVSIGYDEVTENQWLQNIFEEDLVIVSAMPGIELQIPINDAWTIKPFGNLGVTRDFTDRETIVMGALGVRVLRTWINPRGWEFRWGASARLAGEYQFQSRDSNGFTLLETGVDYRRDTRLMVLQQKINAGVYLRFQHFIPVWEITDTPLGHSDIHSIFELGASMGLKRPHRILGFRFERVRLGYQHGRGYTGWTIGTTFPF